MNETRLLRLWLAICATAGLVLFASQLWEISARSALRGYDNTFNYLWVRSAVLDGDWDFENDLRIADTLAPNHRVSALDLPRTKAGRIPNKYGVGWALLTAPAFVFADGIVGLGRATGVWSFERDGFNPVYQATVQAWHLALALLALWLAWNAVAGWIGSREAALAGVVTTWAASSLFYYQTVNLSMSHGAAFFAIALFAYALGRATDSAAVRWWWLAGAGWGLAVITRFQLAIFGIPAAVLLLSGRAKQVPAFIAGAAPFVLLQLWAWRAVYGEWLVFSYGAEGEAFHWDRPEFWNSFFSSWHGLFYWHPLLAIAFAGATAWMWRARGAAVAWGVAFAATAYIASAWWCWWFASAFGNRAYDAALLPLMAGMAWWFRSARGKWRAVLWAVAIAAGIWNFYVAALYRAGAISRNEPVTWREMVEAARRLPEESRF